MQPDETLLTGLQHEGKQLTQFLAFQELEIISSRENMHNRRVGIFESGAAEAVIWKSIVSHCSRPITDGIMTISKALNQGHDNPPPAPVVTASPIPLTKGKAPVQVQQANIFKTGVIRRTAFDHIKSQASSVVENQHQIAEIKELASTSQKWTSTWLTKQLDSLKAVWPQDEDLRIQRLTARTFASWKYQVMCISSLTNMLLHSLEEDSFGRVYKDVPKILLDFHSLLQMVAAYSKRYNPEGKLRLREPEVLQESLVVAISRVGAAFSDYVDLRQHPALWQQVQAGVKT